MIGTGTAPTSQVTPVSTQPDETQSGSGVTITVSQDGPYEIAAPVTIAVLAFSFLFTTRPSVVR